MAAQPQPQPQASSPPPPPPLGGPAPAPKPKVPPRTVLGVPIPTKWPSKWVMIPTLVVASGVSLYVYDRRECKRLQQEYIGRVEPYGKQLLGPQELPRKILVLTSRVPEDVEWDRGLKYFRRYVKPILVAAGIDYDVHNGTSPGSLFRQISSSIRAQRIDRFTDSLSGPFPPRDYDDSSTANKKEFDLPGGTLIVGRNTFKEYMGALKQGWGQTIDLEEGNADEKLSNRLDNDGVFDESDKTPAVALLEASLDEDPLSTPYSDPSSNTLDLPSSHAASASSPAPAPTSSFWSFLRGPSKPPSTQTTQPGSPLTPATKPSNLIPPPDTIPPQPPVVLVPFDYPLGFRWTVLKIYRFFTHRDRVREAGDETVKLIEELTRSLTPPGPAAPLPSGTSPASPTNPLGLRDLDDPHAAEQDQEEDLEPKSTQSSDLDFDLPAETHYRNAFQKLPSSIRKARESYYKELPEKLEIARALARMEREPTKEEGKYPPKTETELREERFKKEKRWRNDYEGWLLTRRGSTVHWDDRFRDAIRVYEAQQPTSVTDGGSDGL